MATKVFPPCTEVVTRRQWRYLKCVLDGLGEKDRADWTEYTRSQLVSLLESVDYDTLPERSCDPTAKPRPKVDQPHPCGCGACGRTFTRDGMGQAGRKYAPDCPTRLKTRKPTRVWVPEASMWILVDPAMDRYETRAL